jgi:RNA polymerase primary sigma factor
MLESTTSYLTGASLDELVTTASTEPLLDERGESLLALRVRNGDPDALERLILGNLRVAVDEGIRNRGLGAPQRDLIRDGVRVLMEAAGAYDPDIHGRFSMYVKARVRRALSEDVRLS